MAFGTAFGPALGHNKLLITTFGHSKLIKLIGCVGHTNSLVDRVGRIGTKIQSQLIVGSVSEDRSKYPGDGPNQHESSCASLLAVRPNSQKSNETHSSSLLLSQLEGARFAPTTSFRAFKLIVALVSIANFLHSEGAEFALVTLQTFADEDQAAPQSIASE
jgi:hypothetical protein